MPKPYHLQKIFDVEISNGDYVISLCTTRDIAAAAV
jgi:hypothetical protein